MHTHKQWEDFCKRQRENRRFLEEESFQDWVNSNDNELKLTMFLNQIYDVIDKSEYELKDKKAFKDEFATFIYKLTLNA
tara:strand:+ start:100 stop:336 length:237 start_codon:yes stop_codon:yes gene_type:complete